MAIQGQKLKFIVAPGETKIMPVAPGLPRTPPLTGLKVLAMTDSVLFVLRSAMQKWMEPNTTVVD